MNLGGWQIHIAPHLDTAMEEDVEHIASEECWCHPVVNEDGAIVHNAADGREAFETGEKKLC